MTDKLEPCILPWINFCTTPFGKSRPCGYSAEKSSIKVQDSFISSEFNNKLFRSIRLDFLKGNWPKNCQRCEYMEKGMPGHSKKSAEKTNYEQYSSLIQKTQPDGKIPYFPKQIDIRLGTLCNLKCIHCGTGNSSKWLEDKPLLGKYENTQVVEQDNTWVDHDNQIWADIYEHLPEIEKFSFLGGEPFASRQHNRLLEKLASGEYASNMTLHYVSNGALLSKKIIDQLKKFKHVTLNISLDMVDDPLEFFRYPIHAPTLYKNLQLMDENAAPNLHWGLQWTSSNISIFYLDKTIDFFEKNLKKFHFKFCNFVDTPIQMSTQNLPHALKNLVKIRLAPYLNRYPQINFYLQHMQERDLWPSNGNLFLQYMNDLSQTRGIDWKMNLKQFSDELL